MCCTVIGQKASIRTKCPSLLCPSAPERWKEIKWSRLYAFYFTFCNQCSKQYCLCFVCFMQSIVLVYNDYIFYYFDCIQTFALSRPGRGPTVATTTTMFTNVIWVMEFQVWQYCPTIAKMGQKGCAVFHPSERQGSASHSIWVSGPYQKEHQRKKVKFQKYLSRASLHL